MPDRTPEATPEEITENRMRMYARVYVTGGSVEAKNCFKSLFVVFGLSVLFISQ